MSAPAVDQMNTIMRTIGGSVGGRLLGGVAISAAVLVVATIVATGIPRSGRATREASGRRTDAVPARA